MEKTKLYELIIAALYEFYQEHGQGRTLEYAFGFFDALGIIRDMKDKLME